MAVGTKTRRKAKSLQTSQVEKQALELLKTEKFEEDNVLDYTTSCMIQYGRQTLENRAIPDYRDGLIPVQRRILYAMYKQNILHLVKSARVVGDVLGKYHPHGDTSAYGAMVTLVQAPIKLIDGSGNWGSYDDPKSFAAMRYTECKLSKLARNIFFSGYLPKVHDLISNFDGTEQEPAVLHCNIPVILALGKTSGIAMGLVCNIPSFTIESVAKITKLALSGKKITATHCTDILEFSSSWGTTSLAKKHYSDGSLKELYTKGLGKLTFLPEYTYDQDEGILHIKSLPPGLKYETAVQKTVDAGYPFSDGTTVGSQGLEIAISLKASRTAKPTKADFDKVLGYWTSPTFSVQASLTDRQLTENAITEGASAMDISLIPSIGIAELINKWVDYRLELEKKMARYEMEDLQSNVQKLDLIILARENFDKVKKSLDSSDPYAYLAKALKIDLEDAKYILGLTLIRLSKVDVDSTQNKIKDLKSSIRACKERIKNPAPSAIACVDEILNNVN